MDLREVALRGGESTLPGIVPGDAMGSHVVKRITLPPEFELAMPPAGKPRPSPVEIVALIDWINRGAPWRPAGVAAPETELPRLSGRKAP